MITGGGVETYLWRGEDEGRSARLSVAFSFLRGILDLQHDALFKGHLGRVIIESEYLGGYAERKNELSTPLFERNQHGEIVVLLKNPDAGVVGDPTAYQLMDVHRIRDDESGIEKRRDPDLFPLLSDIADFYESIVIYAEWTIGRDAPPRRSVPVGTRSDVLLEDASNLAFVLSELRATRALPEIKKALRRLKATYDDFSIRPVGGQLQLSTSRRRAS